MGTIMAENKAKGISYGILDCALNTKRHQEFEVTRKENGVTTVLVVTAKGDSKMVFQSEERICDLSQEEETNPGIDVKQVNNIEMEAYKNAVELYNLLGPDSDFSKTVKSYIQRLVELSKGKE